MTVQSAWTAQQSHIWPLTAARATDGMLTVGGCRADDLVAQFGSPLFVVDKADVLSQVRRYLDAYVNVADELAGDVFYAGKAFLSVGVARWLLEAGLNIDVCSEGELAIALAAGATGSQVLMHGNNKSEHELQLAVANRLRFVVVDSVIEISRLARAATAAGVTMNVLVRTTVGVEAHTHEFIMTAHEDQKFGFSVASGAALAAVKAVIAEPALHFAGLHSHIGSQIFDADGFVIAATRLSELGADIMNECGIAIENLNIGGGSGIAYVDSDDPQDIAEFGSTIRALVRESFTAAGLPLPHVLVEPGRSIIGRAGVTLYTVGTIKPVHIDEDRTRVYVSVDGGMSDNVRTALYDADYTTVVASRVVSADSSTTLARVVGKHCESGDIVVRDAMLPADISPGELLAVAATGAYCHSLASNYNHIVRPAVVAVSDGSPELLIRRETIGDILSRDAQAGE